MMRRAQIVRTALVALLAAGSAGSFVFRYAEQYYREMNAVRLDPLDLDAFTDYPTPAPGSRLAVFYGDSRAADWPAPVVEDFTFINRGVGAQTSAQVAGRFAAHIHPMQPDVLIVQMCINDLKTIGLFPELQASIIAGCLANTRQVVAQARESGAVVILTTVFPPGIPSFERQLFFWSDAIAASVQETNMGLHTLSRDDVSLLDAYALLANDSGLLRPEYAADTLHLNPTGYATLNVALVEALESLRHLWDTPR
jgi:lysophospholipase L1-like esterase